MDSGSGSFKEGGVDPGTEKRGEMSGSHEMTGLEEDLFMFWGLGFAADQIGDENVKSTPSCFGILHSYPCVKIKSCQRSKDCENIFY